MSDTSAEAARVSREAIRRMHPVDRMRQSLAHSETIEFLGIRLDVATLEDLVVSKLEWAKLGGSARQLEDVRALTRLRCDDLDSKYVQHWVHVLGLHQLWSAATAGLTA